jgi:hypothetical protein
MSLFLFPARIRWSNPDGTLTPEAYRSLQSLLDRVGGTLGDQGADSFGDINGDPTQTSVNVAYTDVTQPATGDSVFEMLAQSLTADNLSEMVLQPVERPTSAAETVTPGASPYTFTANRDGFLIVQGGTVSRIDYIRLASTVQIGVVAGLFPVQLGDGIKVTYTVVPTVTFIPR